MVMNPVPGMNKKQLEEVYYNRKNQGLEKCTLNEYLFRFDRSKQNEKNQEIESFNRIKEKYINYLEDGDVENAYKLLNKYPNFIKAQQIKFYSEQQEACIPNWLETEVIETIKKLFSNQRTIKEASCLYKKLSEILEAQFKRQLNIWANNNSSK